MPWTTQTQASSGNGGSVKVGSTGRISTLMMQELEERVKRSPPSSSLSRRKLQAEPVSVHCGALPKKPLIKWRRKTPSKLSSSGNAGVARRHHRRANAPHAVPEAFGHHAPMLRADDGDYDIEGAVLDVKCGNLLSGRLSKLGFSKLPGSAAEEAAAAASSSSYSLRRLSDLASQFR